MKNVSTKNIASYSLRWPLLKRQEDLKTCILTVLPKQIYHSLFLCIRSPNSLLLLDFQVYIDWASAQWLKYILSGGKPASEALTWFPLGYKDINIIHSMSTGSKILHKYDIQIWTHTESSSITYNLTSKPDWCHLLYSDGQVPVFCDGLHNNRK